MKLKQLKCPSCGAGIEMDLKGQDLVFCPYCGSQFSVDDGSTRVTYDIHYTSNHHERYTRDDAVEKQRRLDRENERKHKEFKWSFVFTCVCLLLLLMIPFSMQLSEQKKIDSGMIQPGQSAKDMEGKDYHTIVLQLESAGFKNITTIDLDDAFLFFRKADTVESVSIGGKTDFSSSDYFDPNIPIVISYH